MTIEIVVEPGGPPAEARPAGRRAGRAQRRRWRVPGAETTVDLVVLAAFVLAALVPQLMTSHDPLLADPTRLLQAPSGAHWFGTDQIGRDLFARVVHGAGLSLRAALLATTIALVAGSVLGIVAGFVGGWVDSVISRIADALLAIPGILLALGMLAVLGYGALTAAVAVGVASVPTFARLMRSETMRVRALVYVEAARAVGGTPFTVLRRHVLPNSWGPVLNLALLEFGQAMLVIGALSYLGFGEPPPTAEWGALIASGQAYFGTAWWLSVLPGAVLALVVIVINRLAQRRRAHA